MILVFLLTWSTTKKQYPSPLRMHVPVLFKMISYLTKLAPIMDLFIDFISIRSVYFSHTLPIMDLFIENWTEKADGEKAKYSREAC